MKPNYRLSHLFGVRQAWDVAYPTLLILTPVVLVDGCLGLQVAANGQDASTQAGVTGGVAAATDLNTAATQRGLVISERRLSRARWTLAALASTC